MPIIPFHPVEELENWFGAEAKTPRVNLYEEGSNVVAEVELPGIDAEHINLEVDDNAIKIEAKMEAQDEEKKKGYYRKEMSSRYYQRVIPLPVEVDESKASADYEAGVLKVVVPKIEPAKKAERKVKIKVKSKEK